MRYLLILLTMLSLTSCGAMREVCGSDIKMLCNTFLGERPVDDVGLEKKIDSRIDKKLAEFDQQIQTQIQQVNQSIRAINLYAAQINDNSSDIDTLTNLISVLHNQVQSNSDNILILEGAMMSLEGEIVTMKKVCGETLIKKGVGQDAVFIGAMNVFDTVTIPTAELSGSVTVGQCNLNPGTSSNCLGFTETEIDTFEEGTYELQYLKSVYLADLPEDVRFITTTESNNCQFEIQDGSIVTDL